MIKKLKPKASDPKLKEMLQKSHDGIEKHTAVVKELIVAAGEKASKEHCKGMEGLVAEATKHCIEEAPKKGPLLDALIIAQYQRMTHYGIAGFGTAAAYAEALGKSDDAEKRSPNERPPERLACSVTDTMLPRPHLSRGLTDARLMYFRLKALALKWKVFVQ